MGVCLYRTALKGGCTKLSIPRKQIYHEVEKKAFHSSGFKLVVPLKPGVSQQLLHGGVIVELLIILNSSSISDKMMWEMTAFESGCYSTALGSCTCFDSSSP